MKTTIKGLFVCMLLIITSVLPIVVGYNEKNNIPTGGIESIPILDFRNPPAINLGTIPFIIKNYGNGTALNITWKMEIIEGGILFFPQKKSGTISSLGPNECERIDISLTGLGMAIIELSCNYMIEGISGCNVEFEVKQEWRDLGILYLHLFLQFLQKDKDWMRIEDYSYSNETKTQGVELYYKDVLQKHNVQVVEGRDSEEILFKAVCKFEDGVGFLEECWITRDVIISEKAHWEIELINGE
jgi:hypothetical protein